MSKTTIRTRQELLPQPPFGEQDSLWRPHSLKRRARVPTLAEHSRGCQSNLSSIARETAQSAAGVDSVVAIRQNSLPSGSAIRHQWPPSSRTSPISVAPQLIAWARARSMS